MNAVFVRHACVTLIFAAHAASASSQSVDEMQQKAIQFLEVTQAADGSWTSPDAVGITGLGDDIAADVGEVG